MESTKTSDKVEESVLACRPSDDIEPSRLTEAGCAVADLAHLAKNIMQVLSGCSEIIDLALSTDQLDRVRQAWRLYQPSFWRLKKFQLDLINYTKNYPLTVSPCNPAALITAAVRQIEPFWASRQIRFVCKTTEELPDITVDGRKVQEAVLNLLVTAVDNLQDQPGEISLTAACDREGEIRIAVTDSGPRLDAATCQALLKPYERCRNMLGSGLEIPLAKQVAESHGGTLTIGRTDCPQNTFTLHLPVRG